MTARFFQFAIAATMLAASASSAVVYVDGSATGAGNGNTWTDAYTNLQAALTSAPSESEYWVRSGVYGSCTLRTNALLYGGFAGTETLRDSRDWRTHATRIDGAGARAVTFAAGATLDGFVITNTAGQGGAVFFNVVHGVLANCRIVGNTGGDAVVLQSTGGNSGGATLIRNCDFAGNRTGSAIFYYGRIFTYVGPHLVTIDRCTFVGNHTTNRGGAIRTDHAGDWLRIENCVFVRNAANLSGGALHAGYSDYSPGTTVEVFNCSFYSNAAPAGKAVSACFDSARIALRNCLVWGATNDQLRTQNDTPYIGVGDSDLQGGFGCAVARHGTITDLGGLLNADPRCVDPDGADDLPGTLDDNLRLTPGSPCVDAGTSAGAPTHDRDGLVRPRGLRTDIGAYEFVDGGAPAGAMIRVH